ncbi:hypothetical protein [Mycobacterium mantenii]|nr:hypothetical protein [Mycobacterium mantenii]
MLFAQHYGEIHHIGPVSGDCARHRPGENALTGRDPSLEQPV